MYAGGYFLDIDGQGTPALIIGAGGYAGSPSFTYQSKWAVFQGDGIAPIHTEDASDDSYVFLCNPWDFDGDDQPEICEQHYPNYQGSGGRIRLVEPEPDYNTLLSVNGETDHRLSLVGAWK